MVHTFRLRAGVVVVGCVMVLAAVVPSVAWAAGTIPPGAPTPQPAVQCPSPANLFDWFNPNCPYDWTFADPSVVVVPDDPNLGGVTGYYAFGTNTGGSSLPVMWSTDPVNGPWVPRPAYPKEGSSYFNDDPYFNDALKAPYAGGTQPPPWVISEAPNGTGWMRKKLWAPGALRVNASSYIVYFAGQDRAGHWCIGHARATNPWGPYTAATTADICSAPDGSPNGVIDPQPFRAPDGQLYLYYKTEGVPGSKPTSIYVRKLDTNGALVAGGANTRIFWTTAKWQMSDPSRSIGVVENPAMVVFKGRYYLFYSGNEWRTDAYGIGYATCSGPTGPCTEKSGAAPFLQSGSGFTGAGGPTPFVTPAGSLVLGYAAWSKPGNHAGGTRKFRTVKLFARSDGLLSFSDPAADAKFVKAVYQDFLGRSATASEVNTWSDAINRRTISRGAFVTQLTTSPEWVGATVDKLYVDTLGRPADAGGKKYWTKVIQQRVKSVAGVAAAFYSSPEYFSGFGHSNVRTWIQDLYLKVLLRPGANDPNGVNYWVATTAKVGRSKVARSFYDSPESRHTRVAALYQKLLGRGPDPSGWDYWAGKVLKMGDLALAANLGSSSEYYARAQTR